jgi:hypothetical protein
VISKRFTVYKAVGGDRGKERKYTYKKQIAAIINKRERFTL